MCETRVCHRPIFGLATLCARTLLGFQLSRNLGSFSARQGLWPTVRVQSSPDSSLTTSREENNVWDRDTNGLRSQHTTVHQPKCTGTNEPTVITCRVTRRHSSAVTLTAHGHATLHPSPDTAPATAPRARGRGCKVSCVVYLSVSHI